MNKKTKLNIETHENQAENTEKDTLTDDQSVRKYYYDDAYGYESYTDENDENDDDSDSPKPS